MGGVGPRWIVERARRVGHPRQHLPAPGVEDLQRERLPVEHGGHDPGAVGRVAGERDEAAGRHRGQHARGARGQVEEREVVVVAVRAREGVRPPVGADGAAAAVEIARHHRERAGRGVDPHQPAPLERDAGVDRGEVDVPPVGGEAGRPRAVDARRHQRARREDAGQRAVHPHPAVGAADDDPRRRVVPLDQQRLAAVGRAGVAGRRADGLEGPLLGRARRRRVAAGEVLGEIGEQRLQRLAVGLVEAEVDPQREQDRAGLDLDRLPEPPLAVAPGQVADEVAADQVVVPQEEVAVELGEVAPLELASGHAGGERAVPERPGQPPHAGLQRGLVVDRQPLVEPAVEAELRRVLLAEQLVDQPGEAGHLVEVQVVGDLVAGDGPRVGRQPHLQ